MGLSDQLREIGIRNVENKFKEGLKTFSVTLDISPNTNPRIVAETFKKGVLRLFKHIHDKQCSVVNSKVTMALYSPDTFFDFNKFSSHHFEIRKVCDEIGLVGASICERHVKRDKTKIEVEVSFRDVDPLDLYKLREE